MPIPADPSRGRPWHAFLTSMVGIATPSRPHARPFVSPRVRRRIAPCLLPSLPAPVTTGVTRASGSPSASSSTWCAAAPDRWTCSRRWPTSSVGTLIAIGRRFVTRSLPTIWSGLRRKSRQCRQSGSVPPPSRRCQSVWAPDALPWLDRLAKASAREPAALARWVVDRVDALARMLVPLPRCAHRQVLSVLLEAALSLGYAPNQAADALGLSAAGLAALDEPGGPPSIPALSFQCPGTRWQMNLTALEDAFGTALVVRLRATAVAQRVLHSGEDAADGVAAVSRVVLQAEQIEWIRWTSEQPDVRVLQSDESPLEGRTRSRLLRFMALATLDDDALLRSLPLVTSQEAVQ